MQLLMVLAAEPLHVTWLAIIGMMGLGLGPASLAGLRGQDADALGCLDIQVRQIPVRISPAPLLLTG